MSVDAVALAAKALDGLSMRAAAMAYNLANLGSPQFQALEVKFEAALKRAANSGDSALANVKFEFTAGQSFAPGDERREDLMLVDTALNAGRYGALADLVDRRLSLQSTTIGGR